MKRKTAFLLLSVGLAAGCASVPATSLVDVRVTANHEADSRFAGSVQKETVSALRHSSTPQHALIVTAVIDEIVPAVIGSSLYTGSTSAGHSVPSLGSDPQSEGARPMVGGNGAGFTIYTEQSVVVRGTYQITDASGHSLESGALRGDAVISTSLAPATPPLGNRMSLTRSTAAFLASRVAALSNRGR